MLDFPVKIRKSLTDTVNVLHLNDLIHLIIIFFFYHVFSTRPDRLHCIHFLIKLELGHI